MVGDNISCPLGINKPLYRTEKVCCSARKCRQSSIFTLWSKYPSHSVNLLHLITCSTKNKTKLLHCVLDSCSRHNALQLYMILPKWESCSSAKEETLLRHKWHFSRPHIFSWMAWAKNCIFLSKPIQHDISFKWENRSQIFSKNWLQ